MAVTVPRDALNPSIDAYFGNYERRLKGLPGKPAFTSEFQTALLGLTYLYRAERRSVSARRADLVAVDALSAAVLHADRGHSVAVDLAGFVCAASFGTLPLTEPPLPQIEWVLESGGAGGSVSGLAGSAWRALFLAAAWPYLNLSLRRRGTVELDRRTEYLAQRAPTLSGDAAAVKPHQVAQIAFVLSELAAYLNDSHLAGLARELVTTAPPEIGAPTAQIAQVALAANTVGLVGAGDAAIAYLLRDRASTEPGILRRDEGSEALELSPWVALALLSVGRDRSRANVARPSETSA